MIPDISEFSFGYALTRELENRSGRTIRGAPEFPSLIKEGRSGGGYDVRIPFRGIPLLIQFKLSHYYERRTAREYVDGLLSLPYYRMYLRPLSQSAQHNLLMEHERNGKEVYYAAPCFHKPRELNRAYLNNNVCSSTAFFSPLEIGNPPDNRRHYIAFQRSESTGYFRSEQKKKIKILDWKHLLLSREKYQKLEIIDKEFFRRYSNFLLETSYKSLEKESYRYRFGKEKDWVDYKMDEITILKKAMIDKDPIEFAIITARSLLDCELLIVIEKPVRD